MGSTPSIIMTDTGALIQAMHLFSPSLPIGAFAFSQGLEAAIESGCVRDSETLTESFKLLPKDFFDLELDFLSPRSF